MSLVLGLGAYARDENTSAILRAKKAGGFYARGGVYLRDTTACHRNVNMAACASPHVSWLTARLYHPQIR